MGTSADSKRVAHTLHNRAAGWWINILPMVGALAVGLGAGACANPTDSSDEPALVDAQTGTTRQQIFGGDPDNDDASVPGVVALRVGSGGSYELCSGALLAPNLVLTARHCVTKNVTTSVSCDENGMSANGKHVAGDEDPSHIAVYVGAAPNFADEPAAYATAVLAPDSDYLCDSDIALVVLERRLTAVEPLAVRLDAAPHAGETIRAVGYGQNDSATPIGTRFRKENVRVLEIGKAISASKTPLGAHEFEVARSICQGDSGGPAISEETGAVIGVVSRGGGCEDDFGHIYTTTSGFEVLFEDAFALAKAVPIAEGETAPPVPGARARMVNDTLDADDDASPTAAGCSASRSASPAVPGTAALVVAAALVLGARRRRAS